MRAVVALVCLGFGLAVAFPALAVEHVLLQWKKTGRCEIVTTLPLWGDHFVRLGVYGSRAEAERALALGRKTRVCPAGRSARLHETPPQRQRTPPTYRRGDKDGY